MTIIRRVGAALYAGFAATSLLFFLFGTHGLFAYARLGSYSEHLVENIGELKEINAGLSSELSSYANDSDRVRLAARKLGYIGEGETRIMQDQGVFPATSYRIGRILGKNLAYSHPDWLFPAVFAIATLAALAAGFVFGPGRERA